LKNKNIREARESGLPARKRRKHVIPILLLILVLIMAILLYDSNTRIVTTEYDLSYSNLPDSFDGFRILALSDIHAAEFGKNNERLISKVKAAKPDIIAVLGDFIDNSKTPPIDKQLEIAQTLITGLTPIAPVYYITGNHEWDSGGIWPLLSMLEEHGVKILRNKYTQLNAGGESIILAGTDDPNGPADMIKPADFVKKIYAAEGECFVVMLEHRNNNLDLYSGLGVDLVLCGHAHGGIIRLPFTDGLIGPQRDWLPTHTSGVYKVGDTNMIVSRGIGNHTGYPRFLNNPQIVVTTLRCKK